MKKIPLRLIYMLSKFTFYGFIVQCLALSFVFASKVDAQKIMSVNEVTVQLQFKNENLDQVFKKIEEATDFSFSYYKNDLNRQVKIYTVPKKQTLGALLLDISEQAGVAFKQVNSIINVRKLNSKEAKYERLEIQIQTRNISGKVTSMEDNEGIPGVNVVEKGTSNGTVTDVQGGYSLEVSENATLVFSSVGYQTKEVQINNRSVIDISLSPDVQQLEELVVVGYGTQVRREITGSVSSVKGEELNRVPVATLDQGLQGLAAGVQVSASSGVPGAPVRVMIRGTNSINSATEPLYVIDGVIVGNNLETPIRSVGGTAENPLATINPNDIESIEVLKDAAATAIYGSQGSNGVILVTTKSGKEGSGSFNINYQTGVTSLIKHPEDVMMNNGDEWYGLLQQARDNSGLPPITFDQFVRDDLYSDNDYMPTLSEQEILSGTAQWNEIINTGSFHDANFSTSKAFEGGNFFISANYRDEKGVLWNDALDNGSRLQRISTRFNIDLKPFDGFTIGTRTTLSYLNNNRISPRGGGGPGGGENSAHPAFGAVVNAPPIYPIFDDENDFGLFDPRSGRNLRATMDPANWRNESFAYRALSSVFVDWQIPWVPGLGVKVEGSADIQQNESITWANTVIREESSYGFNDRRINTFVMGNFLVNYQKEFGQHKLNVTAGTERRLNRFRGGYLEGEQLVGVSQEVNTPVEPLRIASYANTTPQFISYFGRLNYVFKGKFLFNASLRRDAISTFLRTRENEDGTLDRIIGDDTWAVFPGVSAGWIISEESFMGTIPSVDFLKVRASYGITGNSNVNFSDIVSFANWGQYGSEDDGVNTSSLITGLPARGITWETTASYDVGVDFEMLNSRLSGSISYYRQDVNDLILNVPIPPSSGVFNNESIAANIGQMRNQGWEFSIQSINISSDDFTWSTTLNLTTNGNEVVSLAPELDNQGLGINTGITTTRSASIIGEFFLARYAGLNEYGGYPMIYEVDNNQFLEDGVTPNPGYLKETGNIIPADRNSVRRHKQYTGKSGLPTYFGGLNNSLSYKGLQLNVQLAFQGGNWIFDDFERSRSRMLGNNILQAVADDHWTPDNLDARYPGLSENQRYDVYDEEGNVVDANQRFDFRGNQYYDQFLKRGDFIRLRTLQLAYNFPSQIYERLGMSNLQISLTGTNLFTITGYDGLDPELANLQGNRNLSQGIYGLMLPPLKMYSVGINVQF